MANAKFGTPLEHRALVDDAFGQLDRLAVDVELDAAEREQVEAGGGDDDVGVELLARSASRMPRSVNVVDVSVTTDARPVAIALNRSPSGTTHRRWSHGS